MSYPEKYTFEFRTPEDLVLAEVEQRVEELLSKQELLEQIANADETLVKTFQENFAYEYPYEQEKNKKSKYSVSELKHASMVEKYDRMEGLVEIPDFLQEERESYVPVFAQKLTLDEDTDNTQKDNASHKKELYVSGVNRGALRGTAVHRVMECLNFKKILEVDISNDDAIEVFLEQEIACMLEKEQLTKEMCDLVSIKKLIDYVKNPVAIRMARADASGDLFREKPFVMDYKGMLLQGIIDVFWIEDEKIVVLDYKTDRVQMAEELITRYKTQLDLYADALCRIFSTKESKIESAEKLIYSFSLDEMIEIK